MKKRKIILVGGTRPNFVKVAALSRVLCKEKSFSCKLVHTGQHYDYEMSESFFNDLEIPEPDYFLEVGSGSHAQQTAKTMIEFEKVCLKEKPDLVIVVGDVNSTLACSITAKKLHIKITHVEAGLRSGDLAMPEEINRIVTDSISDYLFVTEESGLVNLLKEGKTKRDIFFVGNTMIDTLKFGLSKLKQIDFSGSDVQRLKDELKAYGVITLHRPSNVDSKQQLSKLIKILNKIARKIPLVFPVHPRTKSNMERFNIFLDRGIFITGPLGYLEFTFLYKDAQFVLTDSGGLQEETTFLNIPCLTLRNNTERPVTITKGTNVLVKNNFDCLPSIVDALLVKKHKILKKIPLWDGKSSQRITAILKKIFDYG